MRVTTTISPDGEMRVSLLPDKRAKRDFAVAEVAPLVCSSKLQEGISTGYPQPRRGRGTVGRRRNLSRGAKRKLRALGGTVDLGVRGNTVFLTGTLPGSTEEARCALAQYSSYVVNLIGVWIHDRYPGAYWYGVWEYQQRGALHMHLCVQLLTHADAEGLKQAWKKRWIGALDKVGVKAHVDMFARQTGGTWQTKRWVCRTDAQTVEKSVGAYLSKYLSKGSVVKRSQAVYPPASWWFAGSLLKKACERATVTTNISKLTLSDAHSIYNLCCQHMLQVSRVAYPVFNRWDVRQSALIAFAPPIAASMTISLLAEIARIYGEYQVPETGTGIASDHQKCLIFSARGILTAC